MSGLPRCSIPLVYLGMCPDCEIALDLRDGACPKCGSEHVSAFPLKRKGQTEEWLDHFDNQRVGCDCGFCRHK